MKNRKNRKNKKLEYIRLKKKIKKDTLFSSYDVFGLDMQWADIYFFGKNKHIYNATVRTTACALHDKVEELAWDQLYSNIDKEDKIFEIVELDKKTSDQKMALPINILNPPLKNLKGMTASEFLEMTEEKIHKEGKTSVKESFELLPNFVYGTGLNIVIHTPSLTLENIDTAIKKFISLGETNWQSEENHYIDYNKKSNFNINCVSLD